MAKKNVCKRGLVTVGTDSVTIELDQPREIRMNHKAMRRFSAMTGCKLSEFEEAFSNYDNLAMCLGIMLSEADPALKFTDVDDLIDRAERERGLKLTDLITAVTEAFRLAFGGDAQTQEAADGDPLPAWNGAGGRA